MESNINNIVDYKALSEHYTVRDGYVFTSLTYPFNVFDAIVIRNPENIQCLSPKFPDSQQSLLAHIDIVNEMNIEKAVIIAENIDFVTECPTLKYLKVILAGNVKDNFDYSPLYGMPVIKSIWCSTIYGEKNQYSTTFDYSKINGVERIGVYNPNYLNYYGLKGLKSLVLSHFSEEDLECAFSSLELDTLCVIRSNLKSLHGIQKSSQMQCLYLHYNRSLRDISALIKVRHCLRALRIDNCPAIDDFSVLGELEKLELLELSGDGELPSLNFLKKMKSLKTFTFNFNIKDGDLTPCLNLSYVYSKKDRRHYNFKNSELPKGKYVHGNETIEEWRRLE